MPSRLGGLWGWGGCRGGWGWRRRCPSPGCPFSPLCNRNNPHITPFGGVLLCQHVLVLTSIFYRFFPAAARRKNSKNFGFSLLNPLQPSKFSWRLANKSVPWHSEAHQTPPKTILYRHPCANFTIFDLSALFLQNGDRLF